MRLCVYKKYYERNRIARMMFIYFSCYFQKKVYNNLKQKIITK
jgi:hypothetical protein